MPPDAEVAGLLDIANPFERIANFRDVGLSVNIAAKQPLLKLERLYRSSRLEAATETDRKRLVEDFKIKTIIDLRTRTEHEDAARIYGSGFVPQIPEVTSMRAKRQHPFEIPGIRYEYVNFNGSAFSRALLKQLTWSQTAKLFSLYAIGYRKEAISVLGKNVMAPRGLSGLAEDSLKHCTAEVKAVFDVLADPNAYPLIVHCTQGKDRTGLIVLLTLMLLGVPMGCIDPDYRLSQKELAPEREEKLGEIRSIGLPDSFADCPPDWVSTVMEWINESYGGVKSYLERCGVSREQQERVKGILRAEA